MKNKIYDLLSTVQEAASFLMEKSSENKENYNYLLNDISAAVSKINEEIYNDYKIRIDFDGNLFIKQWSSCTKLKDYPDELKDWFNKIKYFEDKQHITSKNKLSPINTSLPACNCIDKPFNELIQYINANDLSQIQKNMKESLYAFRKNDKVNYNLTKEYYNKYKLWGALNPEKGIYELLYNRSEALKEHSKDFEWIYNNLYDYKSKRILLSILTYWLSFNFANIKRIQDKTYKQYFDFDIVNISENEVFVDIGAYIGDTLADYVNEFGRDSYKRFYCYEILPSNVKIIKDNVSKWQLQNITICQKGIGDKIGYMYVNDSGVSSVGQLSSDGKIKIPITTVDDDIHEKVTFIKMDIEGAEESALNGCKRQIEQNHPKLALSVYHNHKDIWKLARIIYNIDPSYRFYLRYYGGNLCPTEYLLYAV